MLPLYPPVNMENSGAENHSVMSLDFILDIVNETESQNNTIVTV